MLGCLVGRLCLVGPVRPGGLPAPALFWRALPVASLPPWWPVALALPGSFSLGGLAGLAVLGRFRSRRRSANTPRAVRAVFGWALCVRRFSLPPVLLVRGRGTAANDAGYPETIPGCPSV